MECCSLCNPVLLLPFSFFVNSKIYKRKTPEKSTLYKIVYHHFQEYVSAPLLFEGEKEFREKTFLIIK